MMTSSPCSLRGLFFLAVVLAVVPAIVVSGTWCIVTQVRRPATTFSRASPFRNRRGPGRRPRPGRQRRKPQKARHFAPGESCRDSRPRKGATPAATPERAIMGASRKRFPAETIRFLTYGTNTLTRRFASDLDHAGHPQPPHKVETCFSRCARELWCSWRPYLLRTFRLPHYQPP